MSSDRTRIALHWFRKGLRLDDNPSLLEACSRAATTYPIFILDPHFANPDVVGVNRYCFLLQALEDLDRRLKSMGSRLYVFKGNPNVIMPMLFDKWNVNLLTFEKDTEPYAVQRDSEVESMAKAAHVEISFHSSHTLHDLELYKSMSRGKVKTSYGAFTSLFYSLGPPRKAVDTPTQINQVPPQDVSDLEDDGVLLRQVPSLVDMGYPDVSKELLFPGGESEGLRRLNQTIRERPLWVRNFKKPDTTPNSAGTPSTTVLSPYIKFGCVSVCRMYEALKDIYSMGNHTQPPVSLEGQLLWREFFYYSAYCTPHFDRMEENPRCKQIPWDRDQERIDAWKNGRTGYPYIDAIMTQLRVEGWIHHLARHSVACFLTRGDLWQHWEEGVRVFDLYLLDSDWALNNANWQWLSCSNFFYQYFRVYSPVTFGKKTDKNGDYIRKWIPQLKDMPAKYIYEPWNAPMSVQKACNCIVGRDYPQRIVEHDKARVENMEIMKAAYEENKQMETIDQRPEVTSNLGDTSLSKQKKRTSNNSESGDSVRKKKRN